MKGSGARKAFYAAAAACLAQAWYWSSRLPPRVASHFDAAGVPNGWMPRRAFLLFDAFLVVFLLAALTAAVKGFEKTPDARLNLPHKEYWLAPERRARTLAWFGDFMHWFGAGTFVLLFDMFGQVFRFNAGLTAGLDHPKVSLTAYCLFALAGVAATLRRFGRTPSGA